MYLIIVAIWAQR